MGTAVRIPTLRAHAESITLEFNQKYKDFKCDILDVYQEAESKGVTVVDNPELKEYPMPMTSMGKYNVEVGRLRPSIVFDENTGIDMFVCGDQLLRGAALNAVLIAELRLLGQEEFS